MLTLALLFLASIATAALSAATGMGGGVLLFISILHFFPLAITIPVHGFAQLFANLLRAVALRQHLVWGMCGPFLFGAGIGVLWVYALLSYIHSEIVPYSIILALIVYSVFKPAKLPDIKIPFWAFGFVGFAAGFLAILIGVIDPFLSPFFIRDDFTKEKVVANKSFMQSTIHLAKLPVFLSLGFAYHEHATLLGLLVVGSALGTFLGVHALKKISRRFFLITFKSILLLIGARIAYRLYILIA